MIKWELKEKYDGQHHKYQSTVERYQKAIVAAGTRVEDLKAELDATIRLELTTGEDKSEEKAKIRTKITEAEAAVLSAQEEKLQADEYIRQESEKDRVTVRELVVDWNGPYRNAVREAELSPIVARMAAARDEYYTAMRDYYQLLEDYRLPRKEIADLEYNDRRPKDGFWVKEVADPSDLPKVTDEDLADIAKTRKLPKKVK